MEIAEKLLSLAQYGALGIITAVLIIKDFTLNKKIIEVLAEIKEAFKVSITQNKLLEESLKHERQRAAEEKAISKDCYEKLANKMREYFDELKEEIRNDK